MNDELRVNNNELGGKMKYRYRTDEEMKDSGVEWIGEIPKEWSITKLKYISCCEDGKRVPLSSDERGKMQGDIPYWGANSIIDYVNDYLIDYEVVLLGEDGAPFFDKTKPVAFYSNGKIWTNNHIHILKSQKDMDSRFLVNSLNIVDYKNYIKGSTRDKLTQADMKEIIIQIPKLKKEQIKISKFLDEKTAQFDSIISKKEALIEKLEEAKKSLISEVVTGKVKVVKSSDGYELVERKKEEMKDSGVGWLGDIPKKWNVKKIKYISKIYRGKFNHRPRNDPEFYDGEYPFIQTGDVANSNMYITKYTQTLNKKGYSVSKEFPKGTLIMTIAANIGDIAILDFNACFPDSIVGFTPNNNIDIKFMYYIYSIMKEEFMSTAIINTQMNLNVERIENLFIVVPNIEKQKIIVDYIESKLGNIMNTINKVRQQIQKLKEAKQSLISEAVTGRIEILD